MLDFIEGVSDARASMDNEQKWEAIHVLSRALDLSVHQSELSAEEVHLRSIIFADPKLLEKAEDLLAGV